MKEICPTCEEPCEVNSVDKSECCGARMWGPEYDKANGKGALKFYHADDQRARYSWPFVYLHGEAEDMYMANFEAGGSAPDICGANLPMESFYTVAAERDVALPCTVENKPAVVVLSKVRGFSAGRIALVEDLKAMRHIYSPEDWR